MFFILEREEYSALHGAENALQASQCLIMPRNAL
jgi:hypothetical protein